MLAEEPEGVPVTIVCPDCGEPAHLLSPATPEDPYLPGDVVAYRCSACLDRWDLVVPDAEHPEDGR